MKSFDRLEGDVEDVAERYLEACIVGVTVEELARMGAVLAAGGIQPRTGKRVLAEDTVRQVLSVMVIAGMYEDSGEWWTRVGLPAKSGVSGAILAVVPGWGAIVAYSPRLDAAGNSVRAALVIQTLADRWGLHSIQRLLHTPPAVSAGEARTDQPAMSDPVAVMDAADSPPGPAHSPPPWPTGRDAPGWSAMTSTAPPAPPARA
jgi:hypothetical protein